MSRAPGPTSAVSGGHSWAACDAGAVEVQPTEPGAVPAAPVAAKTPAPVTTLRRISGVTLSRTAFRTYGRKKGTTLGVRLTVPSRIVLTVTKPAQGRRSKGTCVAPTKKLAGKARCTRQVPLKGSISKAGTAGLNTIAFSGKLRGRALAPGAYTFVADPSQARRRQGRRGDQGVPRHPLKRAGRAC